MARVKHVGRRKERRENTEVVYPDDLSELPMMEDVYLPRPVVLNQNTKVPRGDAKQIAQNLRSSFYDGILQVCADKRIKLHQLMAEWIDNDPKGTFQMMSPFFPKVDSQVESGLIGLLQQIENNRHEELKLAGKRMPMEFDAEEAAFTDHTHEEDTDGEEI